MSSFGSNCARPVELPASPAKPSADKEKIEEYFKIYISWTIAPNVTWDVTL